MTMLAHDANGATAPVIYPGVSQDVSFSDSSVQSAAMGSQTTVVRVVAMGGDCRIAIGKDPTATSTGTPLVKEVPEYFAVKPGDKIAILREGADNGTLNITEGANH